MLLTMSSQGIIKESVCPVLVLFEDLIHEMASVPLHVIHNHACPVREDSSHLDPAHLVLEYDVGDIAPHVIIRQGHWHIPAPIEMHVAIITYRNIAFRTYL